ncbi:MAG: phosphotransferase [Candidatus Paceibacterota bacterium]|jgi:aminoglycoside phosphotransferase
MNDELENNFINWAKNLIGTNIIKNEKEPHGDEGVVYKIEAGKGNYFLKIKFGSISSKERDRLEWFQGKVPVPSIIGFTTKDNSRALLMTALEGKNLAVLCKEWPVEKVIEKIVDALHTFHGISTESWPFDESDTSGVLVHGDACLPNFIFKGDQFSGYIDLGDSQLASPEIDLRAAIWSLQYNLGAGHGVKFLERYGYENTTEGMVENLRLQYEDYQRAHGFL